MSYEAGIIIKSEDVAARDAISAYHRKHGDDFSADYIYEYGCAFNVCGYEFSGLSGDFRSNSCEHVEEGEELEYELLPISEFAAISHAIDEFEKTPGGKKIIEAGADSADWEVGEDDEESADEDIVIVPLSEAHEAFEVLGACGYGDSLAKLIEEGHLPALTELGEIAEIAAVHGATMLGWYESY